MVGRLASRVRLTTDGHKVYLEAVEEAFGADVDYAMLVKLYGGDSGRDAEARYSPAQSLGVQEGHDFKPTHYWEPRVLDSPFNPL